MRSTKDRAVLAVLRFILVLFALSLLPAVGVAAQQDAGTEDDSSSSSSTTAKAIVTITPVILRDSDMRSSFSVDRTMHILFDSRFPMKQDLSPEHIQQYVSFDVATPKPMAFGLRAFIEQACPSALSLGPSCITQENTTVLALRFGHVPEYDTPSPERVVLKFTPRLFASTSLTEGSVTFIIVPSSVTMHPVSIALVATTGLASVVTAAVLPAAMDGAMFLMPTEMNCARLQQRTWMPYSIYFFLPFGSESVFQRLCLTAAVLCGLLLLVFFATTPLNALFRLPSHHVATVRKVFPFVFLLLALFFTPGIAFAAGALLTSQNAAMEVAGCIMLFALAMSLYAAHGWLFRNTDWDYVEENTADGEKHSFGRRKKSFAEEAEHGTACGSFLATLKRVLSGYPTGAWKNNDSPKLAAILSRRLTQASSDWASPAFWILSTLFYLLSGLQATQPVYCFAQNLAFAVINLLIIVLVVKVRMYRSNLLTVLSVLLRLLGGVLYMTLSFAALQTQFIIFTVLSFVAAVFLLFRAVYVVGWLSRYDRDILQKHQHAVALSVVVAHDEWAEVHDHEIPLLKAEAEKYKGAATADGPPAVEGEGGMEQEKRAEEKEDSSQRPQQESVQPLREERSEGAAGEEPSDSDRDDEEPSGSEGGDSSSHPGTESIVSASSSRATSARATAGNDETGSMVRQGPVWLQGSSKERIALRKKDKDEDQPASEYPHWFPTERPHVRLTKEAEMPLKLSPYQARKAPPRAADHSLL